MKLNMLNKHQQYKLHNLLDMQYIYQLGFILSRKLKGKRKRIHLHSKIMDYYMMYIQQMQRGNYHKFNYKVGMIQLQYLQTFLVHKFIHKNWSLFSKEENLSKNSFCQTKSIQQCHKLYKLQMQSILCIQGYKEHINRRQERYQQDKQCNIFLSI